MCRKKDAGHLRDALNPGLLLEMQRKKYPWLAYFTHFS
jgi:hypothetical protein